MAAFSLPLLFCSSRLTFVVLLIIGLLCLPLGFFSAAAENVVARPVGKDVNQQAVLKSEVTDTLQETWNRQLRFNLKHIFHHGTNLYPNMHRRLDVPSDASIRVVGETGEHVSLLQARSAATPLQRLVDRSHSTVDKMLESARLTGTAVSLPSHSWTVDQVSGPNVTDKETVLSFARMAADAYESDPEGKRWLDIGGGYNYTEDFGWQSDGLRGYIFADTTNSTLVISLKGTSPAVFDGSETTTNDKENDNLFFSCCCGQGGQYLWHKVCSCQTAAYTCNSTCVVQALREKDRYYAASIDLYRNVTALYPDSDVWLAGHSLGGAVASLLGLTYGLPVVTFEAPGEALPAMRLGLPTPPSIFTGKHQVRAFTGGYHFGHTADPIYMGVCNSASSFCTLAGYAMQSICHTGMSCIYDTVGDFGWRVGIGTHRITKIISDVIEKYDGPAQCNADPECVDCFNWKFFESNGSDTTTTSSTFSSHTKHTRTQTCKTPGWWGCLDESTTTTGTTTISCTTSTTSCKTPGWFGCKDPTTTFTVTATTSTTESGVDTTSIPITSQAAKPIPSTDVPTPTSTTMTTTCMNPGFFGGCDDPMPSDTDSTSLQTSSNMQSGTIGCKSKKWFGLICANDPTDGLETSTGAPTTGSQTSSRTVVSLHRARKDLYGESEEWELFGDGRFQDDL